MRLKSSIWVKAYIRACATAGAFAAVVRHGDDDAGAILIRVNRLDGTSMLFGPAPAGMDAMREGHAFARLGPENGQSDADVETRLARELDFDRDIWVVEVEDREGRHFLGDWLVTQRG